MKRTGFTLAEVLITLTIIGVIAAITIPNLIQSYKKHQVEVGVREAYSIINNVLQMAKTVAPIEEMITNDTETNNLVDTYILPFLKLQQDCGMPGSGQKKCVYPTASGVAPGVNPQAVKPGAYMVHMNGAINPLYLQYVNTRFLRLANGMNLYIYHSYNGTEFIFDINGNSKPNKIGYDIFSFVIFKPGTPENVCGPYPWHSNCNKSNSLLPGFITSSSFEMYNRPNDSNRQDCSVGGDGLWCSGVIMYNGWKIPDDYPVKKF